MSYKLNECETFPYRNPINYLGDFNSNLSLKMLSYNKGVTYYFQKLTFKIFKTLSETEKFLWF